jgi:hypothetical protein
MKLSIKTITIIIVSALILTQLIPRPKKNTNSEESLADISNVLIVPESVKKILQNSCFDCHSNNTKYPWYASIQPLSLWINHHIEEGKEELNFSEFGNYSKDKQTKKIEEIEEVVSEGEMPIKSYSLIHRNTSLNNKEKATIIIWAKSTQKISNDEEFKTHEE